ncbi:hypothetical protein ABBQ32_010120 [Trebouxia sp. C0010 RCD-2024]
MTKNGQYQTVKKIATLFGVRNVQKGAPTIHGVHCFVGSGNKLGNADPAGVVDIMVRSSACSNSGISVPEREGASCPSVSIRCCSRPSTNRPKRVGLSGQPCLTPIKQSNMSVPSWFLTVALS